MLFGPTGKLVSLYRKANLFETDLTWATPGDRFTVIDLPPPLGRTIIGICNDINLRSAAFIDRDGSCEISRYCMRESVWKVEMIR